MHARPGSARRSSPSRCARHCWWWSWAPRRSPPPPALLPECVSRQVPGQAEQRVLEGVGGRLAVDERCQDPPRPADGVAEDDHVLVAAVLVAGADGEAVARAGALEEVAAGLGRLV